MTWEYVQNLFTDNADYTDYYDDDYYYDEVGRTECEYHDEEINEEEENLLITDFLEEDDLINFIPMKKKQRFVEIE